jgi:tetratricopeptide (TPR) repeat protein
VSDSPEVHLNIGYYYLWAQRDSERALEEFTIAEKGLPNNVELLKAKASLYQTTGRWQEFINALERSVELSPRDPSVLTELTFAYWFGHEYAKAMDACNRAISIAPEATWPYLYKGNIIWNTTGPNEISREALSNVSPDHSWWLWSWYWEEVGAGNYQQALDLLPKTEGKWMKIKILARPKPLLAAFIYDFLNQNDLAIAAYDSARVLLEDELKESADDPRYHSSLGIAYAGLGRREDAIKEGKKAVELLPISKDAVYGAVFAKDLAVIYTMTGEHDLALDQIEVLLSVPSSISKSWLKMDIRFAPLYDHPRFLKLVEIL